MKRLALMEYVKRGNGQFRPNWPDDAVLHVAQRAFDITWPVIRAHETGSDDEVRISILSIMFSHKLVELASDGVTDPQELRNQALAAFSWLSATSPFRRPI